METFNLALLAKQVWRILQQPSSLVSCILKQKYYPKREFLDSKLGGRPSQVWRSLLVERSLLQKVLLWRIGNGQSIKVWGDPWLNRPHSFKDQSSIHLLDSQASVYALMLTNSPT